MNLEAKIAVHQLLRGTSFISFTAWITLLGISIGIASLIVVMSVMNGFEKELQANTIQAESHIILYRKDKGIENWQQMKAKIYEADPSIEEVMPITYNEVLFIKEGRVHGGILEGQEKEFSSDGAFLGKELAHKLQARPGENIKILLSQKLVALKMINTFDSGLYEYSSRYAYAPLNFTQKNLGWGNAVSAFKVKVKDPSQVKTLARKIRNHTSFPFFVRTWMDMNRNILIALKMEKVVMSIILGAIILVALFNVVSSLLMIVIEKTKEISILKAMGMQQKNIARIFLWQGTFVGLSGTVFGILLALGISWLLRTFHFISLSPDIYYLSYLPVEVRGVEVMMVCIGMFLVSLCASIYPAKRAAKLYPVEGIRYE